MVAAHDIDLISGEPEALLVPNSVLFRGTIENVLPTRTTRSGVVTCFSISEGRAGNKTGRLNMQVEHWSRNGSSFTMPQKRSSIAAVGALAFPHPNTDCSSGLLLSAQRIKLIHLRRRCPAQAPPSADSQNRLRLQIPRQHDCYAPSPTGHSINSTTSADNVSLANCMKSPVVVSM